MSAAFSHENESTQPDVTGVGQRENPSQARWPAMLTALLGVIAAPFTPRRVVEGSSEQAGWVAKLKGIIAVVIALLGIPTAVTKLVDGLGTNMLEISAGKDLEISYVPEQQLVKLVFNVSAEEFGTKCNQILSAKAWIDQGLTSKMILNISNPEFEENALRKYQPVIPNGPNPRNMQCTITFRLDDPSREVFQNVGLRRLVVEFKGKDNGRHQVPFCFNIEDEGIQRLFKSQEMKFRYISEDPLCPND